MTLPATWEHYGEVNAARADAEQAARREARSWWIDAQHQPRPAFSAVVQAERHRMSVSRIGASPFYRGIVDGVYNGCP